MPSRLGGKLKNPKPVAASFRIGMLARLPSKLSRYPDGSVPAKAKPAFGGGGGRFVLVGEHEAGHDAALRQTMRQHLVVVEHVRGQVDRGAGADQHLRCRAERGAVGLGEDDVESDCGGAKLSQPVDDAGDLIARPTAIAQPRGSMPRRCRRRRSARRQGSPPPQRAA